MVWLRRTPWVPIGLVVHGHGGRVVDGAGANDVQVATADVGVQKRTGLQLLDFQKHNKRSSKASTNTRNFLQAM